MLVKHIDAIAREKKRDVLFIQFSSDEDGFFFNYKKFEPRNELLQWLDENEILYEPCADFASETMMVSYRGELYIDLPYDETNEKYKLLDKHLMTEENQFKIKGIKFIYLPYKVAMKNAHHDEPEFWEKLGKEF